MPSPVPLWVSGTPLTAKSLVLAAYTCDGSLDHPNGIAFHAQRPILFEAYNRTPTLTTSTGGVQTALSTSGTTTGGLIVVDSAGLFGMTQDQPIAGYYQFASAVKGSAGDGVNAGGWTLISHFAALTNTATQTSISADLLGTAQPSVSGTRQAPSSVTNSTAFFLDLVNAAPGVTWQPAVTVRDSSSAACTPVVTADGSGRTCRLCAIWAAVSASVLSKVTYTIGGTYPITAPAGVFSFNVNATAAGSGSGAGNSSPGGVEFAGGPAGGGENAQGSVGVTPGNNYTVIVGTGGLGGTAPGGNGAVGGNSSFTGDTSNVTAHAGTAGTGATTSSNGTPGTGGSGSTAPTHFPGGNGAPGVTAKYAGGGGSSAGSSAAGTNATSATGAPAPLNGGPGGNGGTVSISVVQTAQAKVTGTNLLTVKLKTATQAGSTVLALVYYQGASPTIDPTATLDDGTAFSSSPAASADMTNLSVPLQVVLLNAFNVPGGEQAVNIIGHGTNNSIKVLMAEVLEVTGLGPSPGVDASSTHTQGGTHPDSTYTSNQATTTSAPDLWVGFTGGQYISPFTVNWPAATQGWNITSALYANNGGIYAGARAAYQVVTKTGTMLYSGTFSRGVSKGTLAVAYSTSAPTPGASPVIGPGGGAGGGLGASNAGANGADGQVTLSWAGPSGSGYGQPALPAPFAAWSDTTTVGALPVGGTTDVNLNTSQGIAPVLNFLSNPPTFRISATSGQSITNAGINAVTFAGSTATVDSYTGWSSGTYTVQRDGVYLVHGLAAFSANSTGQRQAAVTVNGTTYWGPPAVPPSAGTCNVAKTQLLGLRAGDTVQFACYQNSGGALSLATSDQTRFLLVWLGELGNPAAAWTPPDVTFRWQAATSGTTLGGNLTALLQQHLTNDLSFLVNRPYLLTYQTVAQSGLAVGSFSTMVMDTVGNILHSPGFGDNYSGWTPGVSNLYTCQAAGWYLECGESFATSDSTAGASVTAGVLASTSGGVTPANSPDQYQQQVTTAAAGFGGGAAVFGLRYLTLGETVTPQIRGSSYAAAYGTKTGTGNGGTFASHYGLIWMSE